MSFEVTTTVNHMCDRCGKETTNDSTNLPKGWARLTCKSLQFNKDREKEMDLCPSCLERYWILMEEFIALTDKI